MAIKDWHYGKLIVSNTGTGYAITYYGKSEKLAIA